MRMDRTLRLATLALITSFTLPLAAQEICANAWDDDFDGLTDLQDTLECACTPIIDTTAVTSIIPNASFECYTTLPNGISQLNNACGWTQATTPTTDYFVNLPGGYFPPGLVPMPMPNGVAAVGGFYVNGWQEYLGTCTSAPLVAGTSYTVEVDVAMAFVDGSVTVGVAPVGLPPTELVIYGSSTCVPTPLGTTDCPALPPVSPVWDILGTVTYNPAYSWSTASITFTPGMNYDQVIIGPPCTLDPLIWAWGANGGPFMFYDNLVLNQTSLFNGSTVGVMTTDSLNVVAPGLGQITGAGTGMVPSFCTPNIELVGHPDTPGATGFQWFQNGIAILGQVDSVLHLAQLGYGPGSYTFVAYYGFGATCAYSDVTVQPDPPVLPDIAANATSGCEPFNVQFTNASDPALLGTSVWDFGDGTPTSSLTDPLHTYQDSGSYSVTLTVTSPQGCVGDTTFVSYIDVDAQPVASFTVDTLAGCGPLIVNFDNTTDPAWFGTCSWTIGSSGPLLGCPDMQQQFNVAGTYPVTLVVTSPNGCVSPAAGPVNITVYPDPNVSFSTADDEGCTPFAVQFNNDTDPLLTDSVWWDLDDATTTSTDNPSHTYLVPGTYDVSLTVWTAQGCMADTTVADYIIVHGIPTPDFTNNPDSGCYVLTVDFTNLTDTLSMASAFWTFGDGGTSTDVDPTYDYVTAGVYDVTLAITSPDGCVGDTTFPQLITVFDHPTADFEMHPQPTDVFQTDILFLDQSTTDVVLWDWTFGYFGVIGTSTEQYPVQHFPDQQPGEYPVELIVTNFHGCMDTLEKTVVIDPYFQVFVPNSFTPDGDGINDYWFPVLQDHDALQYHLYIYNRWGEKIFESSDYTNPWIGTFMNQGGEPLPQGVYNWRLITAPSFDQKVRKEFFGHVTLLK